jgi:hypothetical protein
MFIRRWHGWTASRSETWPTRRSRQDLAGSRHRTEANPWWPGLDNVETHFTLVPEWFRQEFRTR